MDFRVSEPQLTNYRFGINSPVMEIIVHAEKTLAEIAQEFHRKFPYLKLEFFAVPHAAGAATPGGARLPQELTVAEAGHASRQEPVSISGHMQVSALEQAFQAHFGIGVQVLRRSGPLWLQTAATDGWTLSKQNQEGELDALPAE
jgi:hypothetical protein